MTGAVKLFGYTAYIHNRVLIVQNNYAEHLLEIRFKGWKKAERAYGKAPCPCCGYMSLPKPHSYEICEVCFWEDGGAEPNRMELEEAQENFRLYGSVHKECSSHVLIPYEKKIPIEKELNHVKGR